MKWGNGKTSLGGVGESLGTPTFPVEAAHSELKGSSVTPTFIFHKPTGAERKLNYIFRTSPRASVLQHLGPDAALSARPPPSFLHGALLSDGEPTKAAAEGPTARFPERV